MAEVKNESAGVKLPIYMDNHATTRVDPRVLDAMLPYFSDTFGNAASRNHEFGWVAEQAVEQAREQIAKLIGATPRKFIFTSGATESDNLAIKGVAEMYREKGDHIITQATEHKAVLDTCKRLEKHGFRVTYLPVQKDGRIDLDDLKRALDREDDPGFDHARQQRDRRLAAGARNRPDLPRARRALPHRRRAERGQGSLQRHRRSRRSASITAHKIYGPKGVGALYVRRKNPRVQLGRADRRRRARARHAFGHAECDRHCGSRQGLRDLPCTN